MSDGLTSAVGHGEHGVAINVVPVIRQGDDELVGSSNLGGQLRDIGRKRVYALEQLAEPECATQQKKRNRNGNTNQCACLRLHAIKIIAISVVMLALLRQFCGLAECAYENSHQLHPATGDPRWQTA